MKTATVRDLRNRFKHVSKWIEAGETVQITKRGKPFANVVPAKSPNSLLGCAQGLAEIPPDIDEPLGIVWEAMR
jgi:prevent-host-death family protein